jgi:hypothetical protein
MAIGPMKSQKKNPTSISLLTDIKLENQTESKKSEFKDQSLNIQENNEKELENSTEIITKLFVDILEKGNHLFLDY